MCVRLSCLVFFFILSYLLSLYRLGIDKVSPFPLCSKKGDSQSENCDFNIVRRLDSVGATVHMIWLKGKEIQRGFHEKGTPLFHSRMPGQPVMPTPPGRPSLAFHNSRRPMLD